jgi:hypothetical protein
MSKKLLAANDLRIADQVIQVLTQRSPYIGEADRGLHHLLPCFARFKPQLAVVVLLRAQIAALMQLPKVRKLV